MKKLYEKSLRAIFSSFAFGLLFTSLSEKASAAVPDPLYLCNSCYQRIFIDKVISTGDCIYTSQKTDPVQYNVYVSAMNSFSSCAQWCAPYIKGNQNALSVYNSALLCYKTDDRSRTDFFNGLRGH